MSFSQDELKTNSGKIYESPEGLDKTWYAPNGGKLYSRNLNADSTHPNAWRPPTLYEKAFPGHYETLNLLTWLQPTMQKTEITFEKNTLAENIRTYGVKAIALGNIVAVTDLMLVKSSIALTPMGKVARWAYIVSPWVAMSTSYVATQHIINKAFPKDENRPWTYGAAWISPAAVWGTYKRCWGASMRVFFVGGFITFAAKSLLDNGIFVFGPKSSFFGSWFDSRGGSDNAFSSNDPVAGTAKESSRNPLWWEGEDVPAWPVRKFDKQFMDKDFDLEPSWKKHLPPEDRNKGPPVNS